MEKRYEVKITPHAEQALREISVYIAVDLLAPEAAIRIMKLLYQGISSLDFMPERIHLTPEEPWHSRGIRRLLVKNYFVYFLVDKENLRVQVLDVIYARKEQEDSLEKLSIE